jgi:hypothetical protein
MVEDLTVSFIVVYEILLRLIDSTPCKSLLLFLLCDKLLNLSRSAASTNKTRFYFF